MKKIISTLTLMLMVVLLAGCGDAKEKFKEKVNFEDLKKAVGEFEDELPLELGSIGTFSKIELDEEEMVLIATFRINEDFVKVGNMQGHTSMIKKNLRMTLMANPDSKKLIELCADSGVDFNIVYKGNDSGDKFSLTLDNDDLKEMVEKGADASPEERLEMQIEVTKLQLPIQLDEITWMTDVYMDKGDFVYEYNIIEDEITMDDIDVSMMRASLLENLRSNDPTIVSLLELCKECGADIIYRYIGSESGDVQEVKINIAEV